MKNQWKIMLCLLFSIIMLLSLTACTTDKIVEKEVETVTQDGIKYIIINKVDKDGTVLEEYAKIAKYEGNKENIVLPSIIKNVPVRAVASLAFFESKIKNIEIEEGIEIIESFAFGYAQNLITVTFPSSIKVIGDYAFVNCLALKSVTIPALEKPEIGTEVFKYFDKKTKEYEINELLQIFVPNKDKYKPSNKRDPWQDYQTLLIEKEV